jgi:5-dehydro-2-deoxygluconokinase
MTLELLTMGRVSADLYPEQVGATLEEATSFRKMLGGSPTNVAVACARLGHRTGVITKVGDDGFGRFARLALERFGVDTAHVGVHPTLRTPLAFCEIHPPDDFPLLFYREPTAPDLTLSAEELDLAAISTVPLFWTTGTGLSAEPSRSATIVALEARAGRPTIHDLDHRPSLWASEREAREFGRSALAGASIAVGNLAEAAVLVGEAEPEETAERLLELGPAVAIVKLGSAGVLAVSRDEVLEVEAIPVQVVNGLGAGDAFGGALCHGILQGLPLEETLRLANAAGALVATRLGCADEMPTLDEIEALCAA